MKRTLLYSILVASVTVLLSSCSSAKKVPYFQDIPQEGLSLPLNPVSVTIKPADVISIVVNTQNPELTAMFNLPLVRNYIGATASSGASASQGGVCGYLVRNDGTIDFPVVGSIKLEGLTREDASLHIKHTLQELNLVKDPVVTVDFMNLKVTVLGEVSRPGNYSIDKDVITVLDMIAYAGDLTILGERTNVQVFRFEDGIQKSYTIDLTSAEDLLSSPVYYVQQNDIIYVTPNPVKARQSTVNGNTVLSASFWVTLVNLGMTVLNLIL